MNSELRKFVVRIIRDNVNDVYTLFLPQVEGGPIVSDTNLDEAKVKFSEALKLSVSVRNLLVYDEAMKTVEMEDKKTKVNSIFGKYETEFVEG